MRTRTALAAGSFSPALAGPKSVKKSYTATASNPSPTNIADGVCEGIPGSNFDVTFKAPYAGRLTVKMNGFQGDWDLALRQDDANPRTARRRSRSRSTVEEIPGFKLKKGAEVVIRACNFSGGPTASVTYTFSG